MVKLEFVSETEHIERDMYCVIMSKELYNELKTILKDALNYEHRHRTQDRFKSTDELGNITHIQMHTDKGLGKTFEVRIKPDEKEAE